MDTMREKVAKAIGGDHAEKYPCPVCLQKAAAIDALYAEDREKLVEALELATDLFENGLVDFKKYGLTCDEDIAKKYRAAIASVGK